MSALQRTIVVTCFVLITAMAVQFLQSRFDRSDLEKSIQHVRTQTIAPFSQITIEQALLLRHSNDLDGPLEWRGEVESACWGHMNVYAIVRSKKHPQVEYQWKADVIRLTIQPWNDAARSLGPAEAKP